MSNEELVDNIKSGKSISRYGDGELRIIEEIPSKFFQKNDKKLANRLIEIAKSTNENPIVCIPKPLKSLKGMTLNAKLFWISNVYWNRRAWKKIIQKDRVYGDTQISRPYIDYKNKKTAKERFDNIKRIWDGKKICIIEGEKTHLGEGNDLFKNAKDIKRIIAPAENAFEKYETILNKAKRINKEYIFVIALGPTATVLANDLSRCGRTAVDLGHIDIEYEWMLSGTKKKQAVLGKNVNEASNKKTDRISEIFKKVDFKTFVAPLIFVLLLLPSTIYRITNKICKRRLWLVSEDGDARDNGYWFYRYVRKEHPNDYCYYAIDKNTSRYEEVKNNGNYIKYGSMKHWLFYMSANLNISSQKGGNPCPVFWYLMHVVLGLYRNRVFLQHGVISNRLEWLYYDKCKFKYFVTSTKNEYKDVTENYGYPEGAVILTGLSRWDNLANSRQKDKSILIMPTWRKDLGIQYKSFDINDFLRSDYYAKWNGLLNNKAFHKFIEKNKIKVFFYPHQRIQPVLNYFNSTNENIEIIPIKNDIQKYLSKCDLMITDYSSVSFDFAYLRKPIIYYQFDRKDFQEKQYKPGGFDYDEDGFGPIVEDECKLLSEIKKILSDGIDKKYIKRINDTFNIHDKCNSERIYDELVKKETLK